MSFAELPTLGVGLGFRPPFLTDLFQHRDAIGFLEITADHYFDPTPEKRAELDLLLRHFPLVPHGLNLSLGTADGLDTSYVERLAEVVAAVNPPWWSEHLAFTRAGGIEIGHLSPLPLTRAAVDVVARNVEAVRRWIDVPLLLENITATVQFPQSELSEAGFLAAVVEKTGCGLLLDVTNLHTNAVNHGLDAAAFLDSIPLEAVVQLHFAGGHSDAGMLIDSHSRPTPPPVWALMELVLSRAAVKGCILERDENLPPFAELASELGRAHEMGRRAGRWT